MEFAWKSISRRQGNDNGKFARDGTLRAKVFGGWLVKNLHSEGYTEGEEDRVPSVFSMAMVFVADPNHEWEIDDE